MAIERLRTRRSTTKLIPDAADLELSEQGYTFVNGKLWIKNQTTGVPEWIGGKAVVDMVLAHQTALASINQLPVVQAALRAISDTAISIAGNLLDNAVDPEGGPMSLVGISYNSVPRTLGTAFTTTYGTMVVGADGAYVFTPNDASRALTAGQQVNVAFGYTVMDEAGGRTTQNFQIRIDGTDQTPIARPDYKSVSAGETAVGNVLVNDLDYEGQTLTVTAFAVAGVGGVHAPGSSVSIPSFGELTIAANGAYSLVPLSSSVSGVSPDITYTATDGTTPFTGLLRVSVAPPPPTTAEMQAFFASYRAQPVIDRPAPNPLPSRPLPDRTFVLDAANYTPWDYTLRLPNQQGRPSNAYDFEVGPGKPYTDVDQVPWEFLLPGDRVYIYSRPAAYNRTIVLTACGTEDAWIEVIGVRDPVTGAMPVFDGADAICADGRHYPILDGSALVSIGPFTAGTDGTAYGTKARFIHVTGLELKNAHPTKDRLPRGATIATAWGEFSEGFYVLGGHNICIQGNKIHTCGLGVFVNSTNHDRFQSHRIHVCNNWIYNCSSEGSYSTHGMYLEAIGTIVEFNVIGANYPGSNGDAVKERSSGVVYRYNCITATANAVAFRDPSNEDSAQNGILESQAVDSLGTLMVQKIFCYGNTFLVKGTPQAVIGVGDGGNGELRSGNLYFYSNIVLAEMDGQSGYTGVYYDPYRVPLFSMWNTRSPITVHARNNLFYTKTATPAGKLAPFGLFSWQGLADWQSNWCNRFVLTAYDTNYASNIARGVQYTGVGLNGLSEATDSPGFVNLAAGDIDLLLSSPFFGLNAYVHPDAIARNLIPSRRSVLYPFDVVPVPSVISSPTITGSNVEGNTVTAGGYLFSPLPSNHLFRWYDGSGTLIAGATGQTFVTTGRAGQFVRVGVRGVNESGTSAEALSPLFQVVTSTTPICTTLPAITGSGQPGYPLTVSTGDWTNSPTSYAYQWFKVSGGTRSAIAGATTNTVTPQPGDEGSQYECDVSATKSGETGLVTSLGILIVPAQFDPDGYGVWNFSAAVNTTLKSLDTARWQGQVTFGYYPANEYYFCNGSGRLVGSYIARNNSGLVWYANGQASIQQAKVTFSIPDPAITTGWEGGPSVQCGGGDAGNPTNYSVRMNPTQVGLFRSGTSVASTPHALVKDDLVDLQLKNLAGGVLEVWLNGVMVLTWTDATPITGGYPGFNLNPGSDQTFGFDTWTDAA